MRRTGGHPRPGYLEWPSGATFRGDRALVGERGMAIAI